MSPGSQIHAPFNMLRFSILYFESSKIPLAYLLTGKAAIGSDLIFLNPVLYIYRTPDDAESAANILMKIASERRRRIKWA